MNIRRWFATGMLLLAGTALVGQYGTAPPGHYPAGSGVKTFTGLGAPADSSQAFRVVYVSMNGKMQTFTGKFDEPCSWPTLDGKPLKPSDIPTGTYLTVFFTTKTEEIAGQKRTDNRIVGLIIGSWEGKEIPKDKRVFISCSGK